MKLTKLGVLMALGGGVWLTLIACNLSDIFRPQPAVNAPDTRVTPQAKVIEKAPDTRVTFQAKDCAPTAELSLMNKTQQIVQERLLGLGVSNVQAKVQDACHLIIDLPAPDHLPQMLDLVRRTGQLEFVDTGSDYYDTGAILRTTGNPSPTVTNFATVAITIPDKVYTTIVTNVDLVPSELKVVLGGISSQQPEVAFKLEKAAAQKFGEFTHTHSELTTGEQYFLCIVLDNRVESCPSIRSPIPSGEGVITVGQEGNVQEAQRLLTLLRFGSLPYELEVVRSEPLPSENK